MESQELKSSQLSHETCKTLSKSQILTKSESEEPHTPKGPHTPREHSLSTTRDQRIQIKTALDFDVPWKEISEKLNVTYHQIAYANRHRATPQKKKCGRRPLLNTPRREELRTWLLESPSHRRIPFRQIPLVEPGKFGDVGEQAIHTAMNLLGYKRRRVVKQVVLSDLAFERAPGCF